MRREDLRRVLSAARGSLFGHVDVGHWANLANHDSDWDERTATIAELIPKGSRVLEFGAGRRALARYLDPSCSYTPSDIVRRSSDTFVCDLNARPLPDLAPLGMDVAVFGGVLEYVWRLTEIPDWLNRHRIALCVASYECAQNGQGYLGRMRERWFRARIGWVSMLTERELLAAFTGANFICDRKVIWHTPDGDEPIFVFRRLPE